MATLLRTFWIETKDEGDDRRAAEIRAVSQDAAELEATLRHAQAVGWRNTRVVNTERLA